MTLNSVARFIAVKVQPEELADAAIAMVRALMGALCDCVLTIGARSDPRIIEMISSAVAGNTWEPTNEIGAESVDEKRKTGKPRDFNSAREVGVRPSRSYTLSLHDALPIRKSVV